MMSKILDIYNSLDSISPFNLQQDWDNSGLVIGNKHSCVDKIYACLEITKDIAFQVEDNSLIIAHHPLIFKGLRNIDYSYYPGNIIEILIKKNVSVIAMHTNFDLTHLNKYFTNNILGFKDYCVSGISCIVSVECAFDSLVSKFDYYVRFYKCNDIVRRIGIICGSGMGDFDRLRYTHGIDCIITGDIKYHDAMKCISMGVSFIDSNHYNSECFFGDVIASHLKDYSYNVIIIPSQNPFSVKEIK